MAENPSRRLLLLASKLGYQTRSFADAAQKLGVEVVFATDRCHQLEDPWGDQAIAVHFEQPQQAALEIVEALRGARVDAVLALGDRPTVAAAYAARALGLEHNSPAVAKACRSKLRQREILRAAGLPVPLFFSFSLGELPEIVAARAPYPCVVKPLSLSASQGVIRADNPWEFCSAVARIKRLLQLPEIQVTREPGLNQLLVEGYIPGTEVAVEGLLDEGELRVLAIFDKPDPLEGPFFEETIYVTPSRLPPSVQEQIATCAQNATRALGLVSGPVHAEFRINQQGPWVLEIAPRPIGGLCSRALRFGPDSCGGMIFLEDLLVRHALHLPGGDLQRDAEASGVLMIPVPKSGVLEGVEGTEKVRATPGITELHITARIRDAITAWPEGASYLGFVFARGRTPEAVERSLREAHACLQFSIKEPLPVEHAATGRLPPSP